jgi:O-antigen ligase
MNRSWQIARPDWSLATLSVAVITLPFSRTACHAALVTFILLWISEGKWTEKFSTVKNNTLLQLFLALIIVYLLGMTYSNNASEAWFSLEKKILLFLVTIAMGTTLFQFDRWKIRLFFYLFAGACLIGTFICIGSAIMNMSENPAVMAQRIGYLNTSGFHELNPQTSPYWFFFSYVALADGINIHPTYFSLFLGFSTLFLFSEVFSSENQLPGRYRAAIVGIIIFFSAIIVCLSSRIVILSMLVIYGVVAVDALKSRTRWKVLLTVACLSLVLLTAYLNPVSWYRNWQEIGVTSFTVKPNYQYKTSTEIRTSLWWLGWQSYLRSNPIVGAGTGEVKQIMKETSGAYGITNVLKTNDPHSQYLHTLIAHGMLGLIVLLLNLLVPFVLAWQHRDYLVMGFIFLFAALCLTESALELQKGIVFFSLIYPMLVFQRQSFSNVFHPFKLVRAKN